MENGRLGTVFVEINLDKTKFELAQQRLLKDIQEIGDKAENSLTKSFQNLGVKTDNIYQLMADKAIVSYNRIMQAGAASAAEQSRAYAAMNAKIEAINNEKFKYERAATEKAQQISSDYWTRRIAFEKQASKESEQISSDYWLRKMAYEKQASAKSQQESADYWTKRMAFEKQAAQQTAQQSESMWKTMGIRPTSAIETDKAAVLSSYATLTAAAKGNQQELINLERAKNDQLKKLNAEMVGEHEMSMASMTRAVLRFYAAYYVISTAVQTVSAAFQGGMKIVEDYNQSVASLAAMVVTFSERGKGETLSTQWERSLKYSTAMIPILEEIAAKTILSGQETTALANAFARSGVFLDGNNQKQIEAFTRISNALPLMTQGQEIMRQINTEIRSVMTGSNEASSMMLQTLKSLPGFSMELLQSWRENDEVLEHLGDLLEGFGPATKILEIQWTAVKSTLETTVDQILRGAMKPIYEDIIALVKDMDNGLKDNKTTIQTGIIVAWESAKNTITTVKNILSGLHPILEDLGKLTYTIAYGWGGIAAISKPIGAAIGENTEKILIAAQMLAAYAKLGADAVLAITTGGLVGTDLIKSELSSISELQTKYGKIGNAATLESIDKELLAYQKRIDAYKNGEQQKTDAEAASLETVETMRSRTAKQQEQRDAAAWLRESTNITILKENELNALQDRLRGQEEYKNKVKAYGIESAEAWVKADAARIQAEEKKASKTDNKDAINAAKEYSKSLDDVTNEYYRLTMAEDEYKKLKIWQDWENQAAKLTDVAKATRDLQLAEVDQMTQEKLMKANEADAKKKQADLDAERTKIEAITKAYDRLSKQLGLSNSYSEQYEAGLKKINAAYDIGKISIEQYTEAKATLLAYETEAQAKAAMEIYAQTDGLRSDQFEKAYQETVKAEADILEVKKKALGEYFDKAKWIQSELAKHSGDNFQTDMQDIATGMQSISDGFEDLSQMYSESSDERKKFHEVSMAFNVIEKAAMVAKTMNAAVLAVAEQGTAGPYVGFVAMAAMAAAMASLLSTVGIAFSGGGSSLSSVSSSTLSTGSNGSTLGAETGTGSESIANSYKIMQDTYDMEDTKLTRIYNELRDLNSNMTALVTSVVRTGGITAGTGLDLSGTTGSAESAIYNSAEFILPGDFAGAGLTKYISGFIGSIFGGGSESSVVAQGLSIGAATVQTIIDGAQAQAQQYATVGTKTDGGWFSSDTWETINVFSGLDNQVTESLTRVYQSMGKTLLSLAENLGTDMNAAMNYVFQGASLDLTGKTVDEMNKSVSEFFSGLLDTAVNSLFGSFLSQYQELNEGLLETATRIVADMQVVSGILDLTNMTFEGSTQELIAFSESLIGFAGDLTTLSDAASSYFDKFFSDSEKEIQLKENLSASLLNSGLSATSVDSILSSRDMYRANLEYTNKSKEIYATMLLLADSADQYYSALESAHADYLDAFSSESEKIDKMKSDLIDEIVKSGLEITAAQAEQIISDREQFRAYHDQWATLFAGTDWGESAVAMAESISSAAGKYFTAIENQAQDSPANIQAIQDTDDTAYKYYRDIMEYSTALGNSIDDVNAKFKEYYDSCVEAGKSTEYLTMVQNAQAEVLKKIADDWAKTLVQPILDLASSMLEWAYQINGVSTDIAALNSLMVYRKLKGFSATGAADVLNFSGMNSDQVEAYVTELAKYATTVANALETVYNSFQTVKDSITNDIESISMDGKTTEEQAQYYLDQVSKTWISLSTMSYEDVPAAMDEMRSQLMSYYDLEKQIIADKYQASEDLFAAEIENIEAVRDKLTTLTYSGYNLALPTVKMDSAQQDYDSLLAAAKTGDSDSISNFLSFTDTFLKSSQDANKSSQRYLDDYAKVMADISGLDTQKGTSIQDLTSRQNQLIEDNTKAMESELADLRDAMTNALNAGVNSINTSMTDVMTKLIAEYDILVDLTAREYGIGYADGGIASGPESGYLAKLHGTELVVSRKGVNATVEGGSAGGYSDPEIKNLLQVLVTQGDKRQYVTLKLDNGKELKGYIQSVADELDQGRYDKQTRHRNYR